MGLEAHTMHMFSKNSLPYCEEWTDMNIQGALWLLLTAWRVTNADKQTHHGSVWKQAMLLSGPNNVTRISYLRPFVIAYFRRYFLTNESGCGKIVFLDHWFLFRRSFGGIVITWRSLLWLYPFTFDLMTSSWCLMSVFYYQRKSYSTHVHRHYLESRLTLRRHDVTKRHPVPLSYIATVLNRVISGHLESPSSYFTATLNDGVMFNSQKRLETWTIYYSCPKLL